MTDNKVSKINFIDPLIQNRMSNISIDETDASGLYCSNLRESVPEYIQADCEKVYSNANNAWIVLGRDRTGTKDIGYGGLGHPNAGSIDIVVGRMGKLATERVPSGEGVLCHPDFDKDAARIYLSQKSDIDDNLKLRTGSMERSVAKSAIGIKADAVRVVGREGIKLVTRTDYENSQKSESKAVYGIDLIAGNNDKGLEPMVKGRKLIDCLNELVDHVSALNGIVNNFLEIQSDYNKFIANHVHISPFEGKLTSPSYSLVNSGLITMNRTLIETFVSLVNHKLNLQVFKTNYITSGHSKTWILSRFNNVN